MGEAIAAGTSIFCSKPHVEGVERTKDQRHSECDRRFAFQRVHKLSLILPLIC
jgi:hypothetical protein